MPTPTKVQRSKIAPFASAQNRRAGCGCTLTIQHVRYSSDSGAREDALLFAVCSRCGEDGAGRRSRRQSGKAAIASDRETNFGRSTESFAHMALIGSAGSYR